MRVGSFEGNEDNCVDAARQQQTYDCVFAVERGRVRRQSWAEARITLV